MLKTGNLDQKWEWKRIDHLSELPSPKHGHTLDIVGSEFVSFGIDFKIFIIKIKYI